MTGWSVNGLGFKWFRLLIFLVDSERIKKETLLLQLCGSRLAEWLVVDVSHTPETRDPVL